MNFLSVKKRYPPAKKSKRKQREERIGLTCQKILTRPYYSNKNQEMEINLLDIRSVPYVPNFAEGIKNEIERRIISYFTSNPIPIIQHRFDIDNQTVTNISRFHLSRIINLQNIRYFEVIFTCENKMRICRIFENKNHIYSSSAFDENYIPDIFYSNHSIPSVNGTDHERYVFNITIYYVDGCEGELNAHSNMAFYRSSTQFLEYFEPQICMVTYNDDDEDENNNMSKIHKQITSNIMTFLRRMNKPCILVIKPLTGTILYGGVQGTDLDITNSGTCGLWSIWCFLTILINLDSSLTLNKILTSSICLVKNNYKGREIPYISEVVSFLFTKTFGNTHFFTTHYANIFNAMNMDRYVEDINLFLENPNFEIEVKNNITRLKSKNEEVRDDFAYVMLAYQYYIKRYHLSSENDSLHKAIRCLKTFFMLHEYYRVPISDICEYYTRQDVNIIKFVNQIIEEDMYLFTDQINMVIYSMIAMLYLYTNHKKNSLELTLQSQFIDKMIVEKKPYLEEDVISFENFTGILLLYTYSRFHKLLVVRNTFNRFIKHKTTFETPLPLATLNDLSYLDYQAIARTTTMKCNALRQQNKTDMEIFYEVVFGKQFNSYEHPQLTETYNYLINIQ